MTLEKDKKKKKKSLFSFEWKKNGRKKSLPIRGTPSTTGSIAEAVILKDKNVFLLVRPDGSVPLEDNHGFGLYYHDCRFLNGYQLNLKNQCLTRLDTTMLSASSASFRLTNPEVKLPRGKILKAGDICITWQRDLDGNNHEVNDTIQVRNASAQTIQFPLSLALRAAFEDVFTIRGLFSARAGKLYRPKWNRQEMSIIYKGVDRIYRGLSIRFSTEPSRKDRTGIHFDLTLEPGEMQELALSFTISEASKRRDLQLQHATEVAIAETRTPVREGLVQHLADQTLFQSDQLLFNNVIETSLNDLQTLVTSIEGHEFFAAGVPWFVTLFGRDSLITALQTLSLQPNIAAQTLRLLAKFQADQKDDWTDAQPGKILHELRVGELAQVGHVPQTPYYGTADATPLFLILLVQHAQWTGDLALFGELKDNVLRALEWIDQYGDANGDGYVEYRSTSPQGLVNQGWKDSDNGIVDADGNLAKPPISLVEVQSYVYAAKIGLAELFERAGEPERARQLRQQAAILRSNFNRDFWMEDQDAYGLALDGSGQLLRVVSSNAGHALWTGIADPDKARRTAERLMANDMFSGWGIRTLSSKERAFDAAGYHLGSIWPHDNALIAAGFLRYGFEAPARRIFSGLLEAAMNFENYRLPELFAGFWREADRAPVHYPVSCQPQAWAAGSIPFLISTFLGLEPAAFQGQLRLRRPILPDFVKTLWVRGLPVGTARVDLRCERKSRGDMKVHIENLSGKLDIIRV
jgi:glycogen debranching enzyme